MRVEQGQIALSADRHKIEVTYFQSGGGKGLEVMWAGPGFAAKPLPSAVKIEVAGNYQFFVNSNDGTGSMLMVRRLLITMENTVPLK